MMPAEAFQLPEQKKGDLAGAVEALCKSLLESKALELMMVPRKLPHGSMVQHVLVKDVKALEGLDPAAPVMLVNGGTLLARLSRQDPGASLGAILRPCEIRAFVELVKLHQGDRERVLILGLDCLGTMEPTQFESWAGKNPEASQLFLKSMLEQGNLPEGAPGIRTCCQACEYPTAQGADIQLLLLGAQGTGWIALASTEKGKQALEAAGLKPAVVPEGREAVVQELVSKREKFRDSLLEQVDLELLPLEKLLGELSRCINCYNCRDVCPVCYCKSCVMDSSTMEHPSYQYIRWAKRKGAIKMPAETLFYHMTRMAHMSTSCVGCGQCSSACPMGIRVAEIFRAVARRTQASFNYVAGRSLEEPLPLATFREEELEPR